MAKKGTKGKARRLDKFTGTPGEITFTKSPPGKPSALIDTRVI